MTTLNSRLAELERRLGPAECRHCGSDLPRVFRPPLCWLTTPELKALRGLWQAVVDRQACMHPVPPQRPVPAAPGRRGTGGGARGGRRR